MSSSCIGEDNSPVYSTDYFYYKVTSWGIDIGELTELGKQQNVIVVPLEVDRIPVDSLGWKKIRAVNRVFWDNDQLEKVYLPHFRIFSDDDFFSKRIKIFHLDVKDNLKNKNRIHLPNSDFYYDPDGPKWDTLKIYMRTELRTFSSSINATLIEQKDCIANVNYLYNYPDAPNLGYYFLDDVINDVITYTPEEPFREGYNFLGWYKEAECINQWDFETDIVPDYLYQEGIEYDYKSWYECYFKITYLFAKWEQI